MADPQLVAHCPACQRPLPVPADKARIPGLKARCPGCQTVFVAVPAARTPAVIATPPTPAPAVKPPVAPGAVPAGSGVRPAAAVPSTPGASTTSAAPAAASASGVRPAAAPRAATSGVRTSAVGNWRRCVNHSQTASANVCPACRKGYCGECTKVLSNAAICPQCDGLCTRTSEMELKEQQARQRARTMVEEIPTILQYPISDPLAYVLLSIVVCVFGFAGKFAPMGYGVLFTQGMLMAYAFTALNRVSAGRMQGFMPDITDITDLARPVRLGLAALLVSSAPLLVLIFMYGDVLERWTWSAPPEPVAYAQAPPAEPEPSFEDEDEPADEQESPAAAEARKKAWAEAQAREAAEEKAYLEAQARRRLLAFGLFGLAALWKLIYSPVALVVAGISQSFLQTLNPVVGVDTIRRMGTIYWQAAMIYTVLALVQWGLGVALGFIPIAGAILGSFVESYAWLAIGCTLGLAVFKKAPELGLD